MVDADGVIYTGVDDGSILRIDPVSGDVRAVADTGGRPLGLEPCGDGCLLVCDCRRGLLRVDPRDGSVAVLVDTVDGEPLTFASNVVVDDDGTVWFSASSRRWNLDHYIGDLLEHTCTGRLFRRDPDGRVTTVLDGLKFANGVVLAPDRSHVLVAETAGYRITRLWLTGPRAGSRDVFVDGLPGFPDNMALGSDGLVWVAIAAPRDPVLDRLLPRAGVWRVLVWNLPDVLKPNPAPVAWVMAFDLTGRLVHDLRVTGGPYTFVTSVAERDGRLTLGTVHGDAVALADVPEPGAEPV